MEKQREREREGEGEGEEQDEGKTRFTLPRILLREWLRDLLG